MAAPACAWLAFGFSLEEAAGEPGPGPGPWRLEAGPEGISRVWPAWSYVVVETGAGLELRSAGQRRPLPGWAEALPSETHLVLRGAAGTRAWRREAALSGALRDEPAWSRDLPAEPRQPLPLLPGGFATPRPPFFTALPAAVRARRLVLGTEHALALGAAGEVFTWGGGRHGQLGHGLLEPELRPRLLEALAGVPMRAVAAGGWHSASISEAGDLYVWGWNESGQLALPSRALAEQRVQHEDTGTGSAKLTGCREQLAAEDAAFISIQAFPALLDLPQDLEVSAVSCGSRHTAVVTRAASDSCSPVTVRVPSVLGARVLPASLQTPGATLRHERVSAGKYGQLGHGNNASCDQARRVEHLVAQGLWVEDVVCGPWTTYVRVQEP